MGGAANFYRVAISPTPRRSGSPVLTEAGEVVGMLHSGSGQSVTTLDELKAVVEEASNASSREISQAQTAHRLNAGLSLQVMLSTLYSQIAADYAQYVMASGQGGGDPAQAGRIFQSQISASFKKLDEKLPGDAIAREMKVLADDSNLPAAMRSDVAKLTENNQSLRRLFESASGSTADSVRQSQELIAANRTLIANIKKSAAEAKINLELD